MNSYNSVSSNLTRSFSWDQVDFIMPNTKPLLLKQVNEFSKQKGSTKVLPFSKWRQLNWLFTI